MRYANFMIVRCSFLFFCCWGAAFNAKVENETPRNLSASKEKLIACHDFGKYYREIGAVVKEECSYLQFRVNQHNRLPHPLELFIITECDETALTNYPDLLHLDFGYS